MPSYKLIYFDEAGEAEINRLLFHFAGVPFEDVRVTDAEFQARKSSLPFEQLPVLEIDGQVYAQTYGIATYLAMEFGLFGKTNLESLRINEIIYHIVDIVSMAKNVFEETNKSIKAKLWKETAEKIPKAFGHLEKLLKKNGTGYFIGTEITLADIAAFDICTLFQTYKIFEMAKCHDQLKQLVERVSKHPKLVKYISERKGF